MIKLVSWLFTFLILSQSTGAYVGTPEEISVLIEHARVHSEEYGDNFIVFLSKHYGDLSGEHSHDDQEKESQHGELPFTNCGCSHSPISLIDTFPGFSPVRIESSTERNSVFTYKDLYTSPYPSGIFQPPKQA